MGLFSKLFKKKEQPTEHELEMAKMRKMVEEAIEKCGDLAIVVSPNDKLQRRSNSSKKTQNDNQNKTIESIMVKERDNNLSPEQLKWNKMFDLWADEKLEEPISSLITYDNGIQGEGHYIFFDNLDEEKEIKKVMKNLKKILSDEMYANLESAYENYKRFEQELEDDEEDGISQFDNFYYEHEEEVQNILNEYASKIEL